MIDLIRSLFAHQEWADGVLLAAVRRHAPEDREMWTRLYHIAMVQESFVAFVQDAAFDRARAAHAPESLDEVEALFRVAHEGWRRYLDAVSEEELARVLELGAIPNCRPTVAQCLIQTAMHSQGHRAQCLSRLSVAGVKPPTLDYILWAAQAGG